MNAAELKREINKLVSAHQNDLSLSSWIEFCEDMAEQFNSSATAGREDQERQAREELSDE